MPPEMSRQIDLGQARLHHVGVVVESIERAAPFWTVHLGMCPITAAVHDPIQKVNVQFFASVNDQASVELVEPAADDSPVLNALKQGGGLNHVCFEVENLDDRLAAARNNRGIIVVPPVPATAFDNRLIAFVFFRGVGLVELLQAEREQAVTLRR
jgi:methylmalonyl-CoA/ethylmalonyl-CoA epimerase